MKEVPDTNTSKNMDGLIAAAGRVFHLGLLNEFSYIY